MEKTTVHSIRFVGYLNGDKKRPVFSGITPGDRRVLFETDRCYESVIRTFVATHGDEFHAEATPNPALTEAFPEHVR